MRTTRTGATTLAAATATLLIAAASCQAPPELIETKQAAIDWDPDFLKAVEVAGLASDCYGVASLVHEWYMWASGTREKAAIALRNELNGLQYQIDRLEQKVRQTDAFVERAIIDAKITAIAGPRANVKTALDYQLMPDYRLAAELLAASAANTLVDEHFYNMPMKHNQSRFDPRLASVSFVEAVTTWLAVRAANGKPIDGELKNNLHHYANHLESIARRIRDSVSCSRGCSVVEVRDRCDPVIDPSEPSSPCGTHEVARGYSFCSDGIARRTDNGVVQAPQSCSPGQGEWRETLWDLGREVTESRYAPQAFEETVALWRKIADMPAR
jgi:hypothetical protein